MDGYLYQTHPLETVLGLMISTGVFWALWINTANQLREARAEIEARKQVTNHYLAQLGAYERCYLVWRKVATTAFVHQASPKLRVEAVAKYHEAICQETAKANEEHP